MAWAPVPAAGTTTPSASRSRSGGPGSTRPYRSFGRWCEAKTQRPDRSTPVAFASTPHPIHPHPSGSPAGDRSDAWLPWRPRQTAGWPRPTTSLPASTPRRAPVSTPTCAGQAAPDSFPDAIATTWLYITDNHHEAEHILVDVLARTLNRDPDSLRHLPIGTAQYCAEVLAAYAAAGTDEVLIWPVRDTLRQLARCAQVTNGL